MENLREKKERSLVVGLIALIVIIVVLALIGLYLVTDSFFVGRGETLTGRGYGNRS